MVGGTGARLRRLEKENQSSVSCFLVQKNINDKLIHELFNLEQRLTVAENLLQPALNNIVILKQSNFDCQIKLLCKNLDEAQRIIDRLQNTVWRRFCRWIRLLFTV